MVSVNVNPLLESQGRLYWRWSVRGYFGKDMSTAVSASSTKGQLFTRQVSLWPGSAAVLSWQYAAAAYWTQDLKRCSWTPGTSRRVRGRRLTDMDGQGRGT